MPFDRAYFDSPEWLEYKRRDKALCDRVGAPPHARPYDLNGRVIKTGDRVRSTPGYSGHLGEVVEGTVEAIGAACCLPGCGPSIIQVGKEMSAASLWEVIAEEEPPTDGATSEATAP